MATVTVKENDLENSLAIPASKREELQQQSSTASEYREGLIDYFLKYSEFASWSGLASRLYSVEQHEAVAAARRFIKGTPGTVSYTHLTLPTILRV